MSDYGEIPADELFRCPELSEVMSTAFSLFDVRNWYRVPYRIGQHLAHQSIDSIRTLNEDAPCSEMGSQGTAGYICQAPQSAEDVGSNQVKNGGQPDISSCSETCYPGPTAYICQIQHSAEVSGFDQDANEGQPSILPCSMTGSQESFGCICQAQQSAADMRSNQDKNDKQPGISYCSETGYQPPDAYICQIQQSAEVAGFDQGTNDGQLSLLPCSMTDSQESAGRICQAQQSATDARSDLDREDGLPNSTSNFVPNVGGSDGEVRTKNSLIHGEAEQDVLPAKMACSFLPSAEGVPSLEAESAQLSESSPGFSQRGPPQNIQRTIERISGSTFEDFARGSGYFLRSQALPGSSKPSVYQSGASSTQLSAAVKRVLTSDVEGAEQPSAKRAEQPRAKRFGQSSAKRTARSVTQGILQSKTKNVSKSYKPTKKSSNLQLQNPKQKEPKIGKLIIFLDFD